MTIPKRTDEILDERKLAFAPMTTVPMTEGLTTSLTTPFKTENSNSGNSSSGATVFHPGIPGGIGKPPIAPTATGSEEAPEEEDEEAPTQNKSKGLNLSVDIPRPMLDVATSANPRNSSVNSNRLFELIQEDHNERIASFDDYSTTWS